MEKVSKDGEWKLSFGVWFRRPGVADSAPEGAPLLSDFIEAYNGGEITSF